MKRHKQAASPAEQVAAFRASGQSAKVWAAEHGIAWRQFFSWLGNASRWPAQAVEPVQAPRKPVGFVVAQVRTQTATPTLGPTAAPALAPHSTATVRIELHTGPGALALHWPLSHTRELADLLSALREAAT